MRTFNIANLKKNNLNKMTDKQFSDLVKSISSYSNINNNNNGDNSDDIISDGVNDAPLSVIQKRLRVLARHRKNFELFKRGNEFHVNVVRPQVEDNNMRQKPSTTPETPVATAQPFKPDFQALIATLQSLITNPRTTPETNSVQTQVVTISEAPVAERPPAFHAKDVMNDQSVLPADIEPEILFPEEDLFQIVDLKCMREILECKRTKIFLREAEPLPLLAHIHNHTDGHVHLSGAWIDFNSFKGTIERNVIPGAAKCLLTLTLEGCHADHIGCVWQVIHFLPRLMSITLKDCAVTGKEAKADIVLTRDKNKSKDWTLKIQSRDSLDLKPIKLGGWLDVVKKVELQGFGNLGEGRYITIPDMSKVRELVLRQCCVHFKGSSVVMPCIRRIEMVDCNIFLSNIRHNAWGVQKKFPRQVGVHVDDFRIPLDLEDHRDVAQLKIKDIVIMPRKYHPVEPKILKKLQRVTIPYARK